MCFSTEASFVAGAGLVALGVASQRSVTQPRDRLLAAVPLIFGIQQLTEGVVWLTVGDESAKLINTAATFGFSTFAALWPTLLPTAIGIAEPERMRRRLFACVSVIGALASGYMIFQLARYGVFAEIYCNSVRYLVDTPGETLARWVYVVFTVATGICSSQRFARIFCGLLFVAYWVSFYAYTETYTSVWCFFAALLSMIVFVHLRLKQASVHLGSTDVTDSSGQT